MSDITGSFSHSREERYEVHDGDVIIDRCKPFIFSSYCIYTIIKTIGAGMSFHSQEILCLGKCSTVAVAWDPLEKKHVKHRLYSLIIGCTKDK